uniref:uncharacterized protein LOC128928775 n=1 Tax=Callithrix jacchus TaxID=9483 RepID=UPI0023DD0885|nr:uncharacterized protein LOC128928775 [Callithrix jacchus]
MAARTYFSPPTSNPPPNSGPQAHEAQVSGDHSHIRGSRGSPLPPLAYNCPLGGTRPVWERSGLAFIPVKTVHMQVICTLELHAVKTPNSVELSLNLKSRHMHKGTDPGPPSVHPPAGCRASPGPMKRPVEPELCVARALIIHHLPLVTTPLPPPSSFMPIAHPPSKQQCPYEHLVVIDSIPI